MRKGLTLKIGALVFAVALGALTVPGCEIHIGPGTGTRDPSDPNDPSGGTMGGTMMTSEQQAEEAFAALDPNERTRAVEKASATTSYLAGTIEALNLDPATVDNAALYSLMGQYAPTSAAVVDEWLATFDPTKLPITSWTPKSGCGSQYGCAYAADCQNEPYQSIPHRCFVVDCGDAKCKSCPSWFPDTLKYVLLKSWCAYVCVEANVTSPKVIAVGAGGVSRFKDEFLGPYCVAP
jgi:hypothetical protein